MRQFFTAPTATVSASPPGGVWHATPCPGAPQWSLVIVDHWADHSAQDAWEALPQVTEHYPENWGQPVPVAMVAAFGPWGVAPGDTIRQALRKVRARWPAARP
jgi:hypothetical protein